MLARFSLALQATALALVTLAVLYALELAWLEAGGPAALVLLVPVVVCSAAVFAFTRYVHRVRLRALGAAFERLADGELGHELPPAPDADSLPVGRAYDRMRAELHELTDRLRRTDLSRRQLFADLAHELGTPVATVLALADGLAIPEVGASPERRSELVAAMLGEGQRLARLVGDLRDLADLDDPAVKLEESEIDLTELVRDACRSRSLAEPEGPRIDVTIEATEPALFIADPDRLQQVVVNLVTNAQRYATRAGRVLVTLRDQASRVSVSVEDDGPGVPDELLPRLGERLMRIDPSRTRATGGSGLGLAIVRAIVQRHHGQLAFSRAALGGLRAEVQLPRRASQESGPERGVSQRAAG